MKILLADDHPMVRSGLRLLLEQLYPEAIIVEARDYPEAVGACSTHGIIDLILLDRNMPGMDGLTGLRSLKESSGEAPIVILSASDDPAHVRESLDNGARGYIPKTSSEALLRSALQLVLSGGTYLPATLLKESTAGKPGLHAPGGSLHEANRKSSDNDTSLTQRQRQVLELLVLGNSNKQIARTLEISPATVQTHLNAIFKILGVSNRTEAVHVASNLGLISR